MGRNSHINIKFFNIYSTSPLEIKNYVKRDIHRKVMGQFNFIIDRKHLLLKALDKVLCVCPYSSGNIWMNVWKEEPHEVDDVIFILKFRKLRLKLRLMSPRSQSRWKAEFCSTCIWFENLCVWQQTFKQGKRCSVVCRGCAWVCIHVFLWLCPSFCICFLIYKYQNQEFIISLLKSFISAIYL